MIATAPPKKGWLWPGMVFGLIGVNFCVVGATVYAAHFRHASFAVEADYDRRALHWDDTARQLKHNADLGWTIRIESTDRGQVGVALTDKQGRPLEGALVNVEAFHHAHARTRTNATLSPTAPGMYAAPATIDPPGLWEFRFTVHRGPDEFTQTVTRSVLKLDPEPHP